MGDAGGVTFDGRDLPLYYAARFPGQRGYRFGEALNQSGIF